MERLKQFAEEHGLEYTEIIERSPEGLTKFKFKNPRTGMVWTSAFCNMRLAAHRQHEDFDKWITDSVLRDMPESLYEERESE